MKSKAKPKKDPLSLLPLIDDFLLSLQSNNYSSETVYNYQRDLATFALFLAEEVKIPFKSLQKRTIEQYKAYLTSQDRKTAKNNPNQKKLSSGSINRNLSSLRRYLKFLIDMDYPTPIVPDNVKLIRSEKKLPKVPDFATLIKIIESPTLLEKNPKLK